MKNKYELYKCVILNQDVQCDDGVYLKKGSRGLIVEAFEINNKIIYLVEMESDKFLLEEFYEDQIDLLEE